MLRVYAMYHPLRFFGFIGIVLGVGGAIPILRFLFLYLNGDHGGHVQSLILGGILMLMGFVAFLFAILADLVNFNRQLIETTLQKVRALELEEREARQASWENAVEPLQRVERKAPPRRTYG